MNSTALTAPWTWPSNGPPAPGTKPAKGAAASSSYAEKKVSGILPIVSGDTQTLALSSSTTTCLTTITGLSPTQQADFAAALPETTPSVSSLSYQLPAPASLTAGTSPPRERRPLPTPYDGSVVPLTQDSADVSASGTYPPTPYSSTTMAVASALEEDNRGDGGSKGVGGHPTSAESSERELNASESGSRTGAPAAVFTGGVGKRFKAVSFSLDHRPMD
ncbi:MAG: hypothetical protein Q9214_006477 [Letrouitia sp. 1 TL-2023]